MVRVYRPSVTGTAVPGIVHIHGGGWALLSVGKCLVHVKFLYLTTQGNKNLKLVYYRLSIKVLCKNVCINHPVA